MTDERDPKLQSAYRALGAEESPRALDDAILAAARRSARPWTQRWALPLSIAAVVVLSVTVTLRIQHEQPGIESPETARAPSPARAPAMQEAAPPASLAKDQALTEARIERKVEPQAKTESVRAKKEIKEGNVARNEPVPFQAGAREQAPASAEVASSAATAPTPPAAPAAPAAKPALQGALGESLAKHADEAALPPEKELERIAQLRRDGKHDEADKVLAEFRKRYPDFKIPAPMLERVERR